jgi:hypothetical protein
MEERNHILGGVARRQLVQHQLVRLRPVFWV